MHRKLSSMDLLASNLLNANQQNDMTRLNKLLQELKAAVNIPGDINCLIGPVVQLLPCTNLQVKRAVYSILPRICSYHPDTALLISNTLLLDTEDPNPIIKCLAIEALAAIPSMHQEYACKTLNAALADRNPSVRLAAVNGCGTAFRSSPELIKDQGLIERLYASIRDPDPYVATSSLIVLDTILAAEEGVEVSRSVAGNLLGRLPNFPDRQLATVLQVLCKYQPAGEEELFKELSLLDPYLVWTTSAAVVVNCVRLFLKLISTKYPHLEHEIVKQSVPVMKGYLAPTAPRESTSHVLEFLLEVNYEGSCWLPPFTSDMHLFYPRDNLDLAVSLKLLKFLPYLSNENNFNEILNVLNEKFCKHTSLSESALGCICIISKKIETSRTDCLNIFISLLDSSPAEHISNNILAALKNLEITSFQQESIDRLLTKLITLVNFEDGKNELPEILPCLLGDFGSSCEKVPYVLEAMAKNFCSYDDDLKHLILTCSVKLFLKFPPIYQHILGEILDKSVDCKTDNDEFKPSYELQARALRYYSLIESDIDLLRDIMI